jgi:hypothetical protein
MQSLVTPDRWSLDSNASARTSDDVIDLLQNAPAVTVKSGLEIIDLNLNVLEDISDDLAGGTIRRDSFAELHAAATLQITRLLDWGADIVRPYYVIADDTRTARFSLGAYHVNTPDESYTEFPITYEVTGYDMLWRLQQPVGDAYSIAMNTPYLATVEAILLAQGYTEYIIDQDRASTFSPTTRAWEFSDSLTWLNIVNDLLAAVGYEGIWSDWDGRLRCQPYILPDDRTIEWVYTDDPATTMLSTERVKTHDFFAAPNSWVFYQTNRADGATPSEGDGIYSYSNNTTGDTSIEARRGMVITKVVGLDVADQGALISNALITIAADMAVPTTIALRTFPNPLHWHFDRLVFSDQASLPIADVQCTSWELALAPSTERMSQNWTVI